MKTLLLLIALAIAAPVFTGCGTTGQVQTTEARVFLTFKDTYAVARAAYEGFCLRVVQGKATKEAEAQADDAWNKFRAAFKVAFNAASSDWSKATPADVQALSDVLIKIIHSL